MVICIEIYYLCYIGVSQVIEVGGDIWYISEELGYVNVMFIELVYVNFEQVCW